MKGSDNIGVYLQKFDALIRQIPAEDIVESFSCQTKEFQDLLFKIADKRHRDTESEKRCYKRLIRDSKRFEKIFRERAGKHLKFCAIVLLNCHYYDRLLTHYQNTLQI